MLVIVVSYGYVNGDPFNWPADPFTCSETADPLAFDINVGDEARAWICSKKDIKLYHVDEVLIVDYLNGECQVIRHHIDNLTRVEP